MTNDPQKNILIVENDKGYVEILITGINKVITRQGLSLKVGEPEVCHSYLSVKKRQISPATHVIELANLEFHVQSSGAGDAKPYADLTRLVSDVA